MATDEQIQELMQIAINAQKYSELEAQLLKNVVVDSTVERIKPLYRKEPTYEQKQRFYENLHRPYGL